MKNIVTLLAAIAIVSGPVALAVNAPTHPTRIPQSSHSHPTRHPTTDPNQEVGTIAGALAGGLLGYYFSDHSSTTKKVILTSVGALAGGYVGRIAEKQIKKELAHHTK